jgi:hypothetical protein
MTRYPRGEPIDFDPELDLVDDGADAPELQLGQVWRDFVALGRFGMALQKATPRPTEPGVIDMVEVAPGIYARRKNPGPVQGGPLGRINAIHRAFARLQKDFT